MTEQASNVIELKPEGSQQDRTLRSFFTRLKTIRNLSLGLGMAGTGVMVGSAYKPIGPVAMTLAATVTTLALSTAATAQLLLSLNEQLEVALNQPTRKPGQQA
ncbi:MAG: hypothetical protein CVV27_15390 [Candidatus Melainabacteria bacterium HGW-Melainabacteria-1]|nr:MAG: hypothetical protein CVV27_15390 [Candidatus Melainabacteria bacterium HGW-Melainabacteria-1]